MPEPPILALLGGAALVALAVFLWWRKREGDRRAELERLSHILGWSYFREAGLETIAELEHFPLFGQGRRRRIRNLLRRTDGAMRRLFFDYLYVTGGGQHSQSHRLSLAAFEVESELPVFALRPEHLLHKIGSAFGFQDIDFDASPEFSRRYLLRGEDEDAVRTLFGPSVRAFFDRQPGWSIEGGGNWLVFYRHGKRVPPSELSAFLESCKNVLTALSGR